jgi:hypothetical protein
MRQVTLRGLFAHKLRLALTALAIVLGVTFISGTFVLTDTLNNTFSTLFASVYSKIDFQVRGVAQFGSGESATRNPLPESLLARLRSAPGVAAAYGQVEGYAQFVARDGKPVPSTVGTIGLGWDPAWRTRVPHVVVFVVGLQLITLALVLWEALALGSGWFGFLAAVCFGYTRALPRLSWQLVGAGVASFTGACAQTAGLSSSLLYHVTVGVVALTVDVLLYGSFMWLLWEHDQQVARNQRALTELEAANRRLEATIAENEDLHQQLLGCSSARPRSRRTCCTSTPSSALPTAPPPSPRPSTAACSPRSSRTGTKLLAAVRGHAQAVSPRPPPTRRIGLRRANVGHYRCAGS